ncbi:MAG: hypothetical protein J3K34DRAFT_525694 [Monoraphidium minutum]|nr:MAG: hypothetical protein J3K34DRAFT_525694 [Monoraphidium minutum]
MSLFGGKAPPPPPPFPSPPMPPGLDLPTEKPEYQNNISSVIAALTINGVIGAVCLTLFIFFRSFMPQYQLRSVLNYVTIRPPAMPKGVRRVFGWIWPVLQASDVWLLHSAGLDALVLQKTQALCMQIFLPIATIGCALLMPLQLSEAFESGDTTFSRLTMANVGPGSKIMWAHWVATLAFLGWTMLLLEWHLSEYVTLRQVYLRGGGGWNYWRELNMAEADGVGAQRGSRFSAVVDSARMEGILKAMDTESVPPTLTWWRKSMAWLTSWTGTGTAEDVVAMAQELTASDSNNRVVARLLTGKQAAHTTHPQPAGARAAPGPLGEGAEDGGSGSAPAVVSGDAITSGAVSPEQVVADLDAAADEEAFNHMAAPKWWSMVDSVPTEDGKLRRLTAEERAEAAGSHVLLAKPSVRYRKTVNTFDHMGRRTAVHAQQYAVLVTNVNQPVYPEFQGDRPVRGAGTCGAPSVKHGVADDVWLGARHREFVEALHASKEAAEQVVARATALKNAPASGAAAAASAVAALEAAEAGLPSGVAPRDPPKRGGGGGGGGGEVAPGGEVGRAAELWGAARAAMASGRLRRLLGSEAYGVVGAVFSALFPEDFDRVVPVFNFREADLLMRQWDRALGQLEAAEQAVKMGGKRGTTKPKGSKVAVDRIEWLRSEVARLERAVLEARERALVYNSTPSFFVLFRSQKAAAIAASCNIHPLKRELFKVHPAPGPEEVNWEALWFTHAQRMRRGFFVTPFIIIIVLLPVSMLTSAMTQLNDLFCAPTNTVLLWPAYCTSPHPFFNILRAVLTGFVPTLLIMLWQALVMPRAIYLCAQSEGRYYSLSDLDRRIGSVYFLWGCFNFFLGGVIGSTALARVPEFINKPLETPQLLGFALPATAKFFFTYMILRTFMSMPLRFLIPNPAVWQAWIRMAIVPFVKSCRDNAAAERTLFMRSALRSPRYGVEYGANTCLILLICYAFAVICPLIPLFAIGFFTAQWLFWRYQLIYGFQRKYESGGQFFPFVVSRVLVCAAVMVAFTGCVMIVKRAWAQATLLWVIGLVSVYAFHQRTQEVYGGAMREMPLLLAQMAPRARVPATVYVPPPLQANGWLWYPEFNRVWEFFGMPGYSW